MASGITKKEIAKSVKSLIVMLQSLTGQQVTITLRNDTIVRGTILKVDPSMSIELGNASVEEDLFYRTIPVKHVASTTESNTSPSQTKEDQDKLRSDNQTNCSEDQDFPATRNIDMATNLSVTLERCNKTDEDELTQDDECRKFRRADVHGDSIDHDDDVVIYDDNSNDTEEAPAPDMNYYLVKGSRIRYIQLPSHLDMIASAREEIERLRNRRKRWTKKDIVRPSMVTKVSKANHSG